MTVHVVTRHGWPEGMDTVHADNELKPTQLRRAVNVDVLDSGKVRLRQGFSSIATSLQAHSLWSAGDVGYYVDNGTLTAVNGDLIRTPLAAVLNPNDPIGYEQVNGEVYFTSASMRGKISAGVVGAWGLPQPAVPPTLAPGVGFLQPGVYAAAITYVDASGRESAASLEATVTLATLGSLTVTWPAPPVGFTVNVYCTATDGGVLHLAGANIVGTSLIVSQPPSGRACVTQYKAPPPLGRYLAYLSGHLYIAAGNVLWFTEPFNYDLVDRRKGFYMFGAPITVLAAVNDGLYICADKTYFLSAPGTPEVHQQIVFDDMGGMDNTLAHIPGSVKVAWLSPRGAVVGDNGGQVEVLSEGRVRPGQFTGTAAMVREQGGVRQYVAIGQRVADDPLNADTFLALEALRRAR